MKRISYLAKNTFDMRYLFLLLVFQFSISLFSQDAALDSTGILLKYIDEIQVEKLKENSFGSVINLPEEKGKYPIHYAVEKGNIEVIKLLLDLGANINQKDADGYSPLHYAVISEKTGLVNYIIQKGAEKFILNNRDELPVDIAYNLDNENIVNLLLSKNKLPHQLEKYRLWRNKYFVQSSIWESKSADFKMAWINGSIIMGELFKLVKDSLTEKEMLPFKILEEDQKHFEYENEFQMDMNFKISLCDQLLALLAEKTSNAEVIKSLSLFLIPSNQSQIQLQQLKTNLLANPTATDFIRNNIQEINTSN